MRGQVRLYVPLSLDGHVTLYLSPLNLQSTSTEYGFALGVTHFTCTTSAMMSMYLTDSLFSKNTFRPTTDTAELSLRLLC